jgi:hypothetical protein
MMMHMYFIVPDLHDDDGTHAPVLYQIYMMMMIHMYFIVPDLHDDDGTHAPHVYHHHHVDLVQYMYMCTIIIMSIWYNTGACVPSSSCRSGTIKSHGPVLYQIYMMMVHMYLYCTRSTWWWYTCTCLVPDLHHHHHVDLVQYRCMCTIIIM